MSKPVDYEFGTVRSFVWPIYRHEVKKVLPMLSMLFLICFSYGILQTMKDSIVLGSQGAEVIPFIKVWVLLPMALLLTLIFTKLSNRYSQERVFYIMTTGFLTTFATFAFILYPLRDVIHPHETAKLLGEILPNAGFFKGLIGLVHYWSFTAFYVLAELWGSIVLQVLFWGFANEITRVAESRRFYAVCGIGSNLAAIAAGLAGVFFSSITQYNPLMPFGQSAEEQTVMVLVLVVLMAGIGTMSIFRWMNRNVLNDPSFDDLHNLKKETKKKGKLSIWDSFSYLSNSRYLICIAVLVLAYNLVINIVEVVWKDQLKQLYANSLHPQNDIQSYMSYLKASMGVVSTITTLFIARIIGRFGWTRTALITPIIMLITSTGFFVFSFFQNNLGDAFLAYFGMTPLAIAVFFGSAQNCLSKAAKYSVFDPTKEMAFIPLSHESKLKGKAAIDGVGSRLGKSGGSLIHQGLLMFLSTVGASIPFVAAILMVVIGGWIMAARSLGRQFNELVASQQTPAAPSEELAAITHTEEPDTLAPAKA